MSIGYRKDIHKIFETIIHNNFTIYINSEQNKELLCECFEESGKILR